MTRTINRAEFIRRLDAHENATAELYRHLHYTGGSASLAFDTFRATRNDVIAAFELVAAAVDSDDEGR